jgi:flavorubredoxin
MVNAYLVREDDGLTLIDTMIGGSAGKVGSLDELKENLPQAEVIISARDARLLARDMSLDPD